MAYAKRKSRKNTHKTRTPLKLPCRLHVLRAERGWTLERTAKEVGVSMGTIWKVEQGGDCMFSIICRILRVFGVTLEEMYPTFGKKGRK